MKNVHELWLKQYLFTIWFNEIDYSDINKWNRDVIEKRCGFDYNSQDEWNTGGGVRIVYTMTLFSTSGGDILWRHRVPHKALYFRSDFEP